MISEVLPNNIVISNEIFELLEANKSVRARVFKLQACTCTKGKGITRKSRRFCNYCEALIGLRAMRRRLEKLKEGLRLNAQT